MIDYDAQVGSRIRSTRELMGLTRERFAELCDISDSFLADVELGKKSPTVRTLNKICVAAKISAEYIVSGTAPDGTVDERYTAVVTLLKSVNPERLQCCADMLTLLIKEFSAHPVNE